MLICNIFFVHAHVCALYFVRCADVSFTVHYIF